MTVTLTDAAEITRGLSRPNLRVYERDIEDGSNACWRFAYSHNWEDATPFVTIHAVELRLEATRHFGSLIPIPLASLPATWLDSIAEFIADELRAEADAAAESLRE